MTSPYAPAPPPGPYGSPPQFAPPNYPRSQAPAPTAAPPPAAPYPSAYPASRPLPRPAVVTMAATMTVTASLQWICTLSFAWLVATAGAANLSSSAGREGSLFHLLHRFHYRMVDGLAWPLYLMPLASFVAGFLVLAPRPWARWSLTALGLLSLGWSAWWLRNAFVWWLPPAMYIIVACAVLWTPGATQWYRARGRGTVL